ncbi:MAG: OmpA family protein [Pseudomonadota bacterium]
MALKAFKDSLPWLVPSLAIVIGASGVLNGGFFASDPDEPQQVVTTAVPAPVAVPEPTPEPAVVTRNQSAPLLSLDAARPEPEPAPAPAPQVTSTARERQLAAAAAAAAAPTFGQGTAFDTARAQCIDDLKALAEEARVYFPSGGTSADASGIEQGRLIGLIAQGCRDVRIRVEGHSDASGNPANNLRLSRARAEEVIERIGASGVDTSMFIAEGFGDQRPSGLSGPEPRAYYDRRVEFSVIDEAVQVVTRAPLSPQPWAASSCAADLERAVKNTVLFYAPGSVSLRGDDIDTAFELAEKAMLCPQARLRVVGHYSNDAGVRETVMTGQLRAKALMAMLVARGAAPEQIIISAPSWPADSATTTGLPAHRVNFDVILEEG